MARSDLLLTNRKSMIVLVPRNSLAQRWVDTTLISNGYQFDLDGTVYIPVSDLIEVSRSARREGLTISTT